MYLYIKCCLYTLEDLKWDAFHASHLIFKGNVADK